MTAYIRDEVRELPCSIQCYWHQFLRLIHNTGGMCMVDKKDGISFLYFAYYSLETCYVVIKHSYIRDWSPE